MIVAVGGSFSWRGQLDLGTRDTHNLSCERHGPCSLAPFPSLLAIVRHA